MAEAWLEELSLEDCLVLLRDDVLGRVSIVVDDFPLVLPINYRLVETSGRTWVAIRTRPGNVIERASMRVAFEIDGFDAARKQGWAVLVRGTLHHVDPDAAGFRERFDPHPWLEAERDAWLIVEPFSITGRRLHRDAPEWAFTNQAYL